MQQLQYTYQANCDSNCIRCSGFIDLIVDYIFSIALSRGMYSRCNGRKICKEPPVAGTSGSNSRHVLTMFHGLSLFQSKSLMGPLQHNSRLPHPEMGEYGLESPMAFNIFETVHTQILTAHGEMV
jgi:hypothetical protein